MTRRKDTRPHFIYKMLDPRGKDNVKYIGQTIDPIEKRLSQHLRSKSNAPRDIWVRSLLSEGIKPVIERIETVPVGGKWWEREKYWIQWHWDNGYELVNSTAGGEGCVGLVHTEKTREKMRQRAIGRKPPSWAIEKARQVNLGRKRSVEHIERTRLGCMKPIAQYTYEGKFIDKWDSAKTAGESLDIARQSINSCAKRKIESAGDYQWRYWSETLGADIEPYIDPRNRPVARYTLDNVFIDEWGSAAKAGEALGIDPSGIAKCAKNNGKNMTAGGFRWYYLTMKI